jgi:hypothetical protein
LTITNGRYRIESKYPEHYFICYDSSGEFIQTVPVSALEGDLSETGAPADVMAIALWAEDSEYFTSALTNIVTIR